MDHNSEYTTKNVKILTINGNKILVIIMFYTEDT